MRIARVTAPGSVHHVISRFVDRNWMFREDEERTRYLALLGRALSASDWRCLAWALMSNHIHLALVAGEQPLSSWARRVNPPFAGWLNEKYDRLGPIFAARPTTWIVRPHDEGRLVAYLHNNPVRAGVVKRASESPWTSHRAYLGLAPAPAWLAVREGLRRSGCADMDEFAKKVDADAGLVRNDPELAGIRAAARKRGAVEVATPILSPLEIPLVARRFAHIRVDPLEVIEGVAATLDLETARVQSSSKQPHLVAARRLVVHATKTLGISNADVASALGVSEQATSRHGLTPLRMSEAILLARIMRKFRGTGSRIGRIRKASP